MTGRVRILLRARLATARCQLRRQRLVQSATAALG